MKPIRTRTPVRIDLAGGTLDIWPLYLFLPKAKTINLAINLYAETELRSSLRATQKGQPEVILKSADQNSELVSSWNDLAQREVPAGLILHQKLLAYFLERYPKKKPKFLTLETRATSPAGAGLGGSSALSISLVGALAAQFLGRGKLGSEKARTELIEVTRDIETKILGVPAGLQDYYGAMFGGLQELNWGVQSHSRATLKPKLLKELSSRLILFYSGHSRNSGINNWQLYKAFLDQDHEIRNKFQAISQATHSLGLALRQEDWKGAVSAVNEEWLARRQLASGISTPEINQALEEAKKESEIGFKICGAGGGGCFFILLPIANAGIRERIIQRVASNHIRHLPFQAVSKGLEFR